MIKRATHEQTSKASVWRVKLEKGQSKGRALAAYNEFGDSLQWDDVKFKDGELHVIFGIDEHIGILDYEYEEEGPNDPVVVEGEGGVIQVYITQHNYSPKSQQ